MIVPVLIIVCLIAAPVMADGTVRIISEDGETEYRVYQILRGKIGPDNMISAPEIGKDLTGEVLNALGFTGEKEPSAIAGWLLSNIESRGEAFADSFEKALKDTKTPPLAVIKSGKSLRLCDGYYLIASDEFRPVLQPVSEENYVEIHEKPVMKSAPSTGDNAHIPWMIALLILSGLGMTLSIVMTVRDKK